jgi:protein disulfide isomerase
MVEARKKFEGDASDLSIEALKAFAERVAAGEVKPFLKSAPIPTSEKGSVKTIVGKNFKEAVLDSDKEVLLKVYAPWCGHCKTIAPEFEAAAAALKINSNVILAEFDGTLNEVDEIQIKGYPTLYWYGKDKTQQPLEYNGGRDKDGIISWIKDHTEYEWAEAAAEEATDSEEL